MAKQEQDKDALLAEALAKLANIMEGQTAIAQKADDRVEADAMDKAEGRRAGRSFGANGVFENRRPPEISQLNPRGDRDFPRPELKCEMIWVGYKLSNTALSHEEITLANQIEPGEYRVTKSDGSSIDFRVGATKDAAGKLDRLTFHFPCKQGADRHNHMPMIHYLREALEQHKARA